MQGRTVKSGSKLIIHWSNRFKEHRCRGMAYVCLGRCEKLEDIYIRGEFDPAGIRCCQDALKESQRLEKVFEETKLKEDLKFASCFTISYLNINRMNPHYDDILVDPYLMKSDVISFGETWLNPDQTISFDGYHGDQVNIGDGKGVSTFIKGHFQANWKKISNDKFSGILMETDEVNVITLYLSKGFNWTELYQTLEEWIVDEKDVAILGDMNINYLKKTHELITYLKKRNFTQLVEKPTQKLGGLLDHIYVSQSLLEKKPFCSQRSVYYSDHDNITLHIPRKYCEDIDMTEEERK